MYLIAPRFAVPHLWAFVGAETMHESRPVRIQSQIDATSEIEFQSRKVLSQHIIDCPVVRLHWLRKFWRTLPVRSNV